MSVEKIECFAGEGQRPPDRLLSLIFVRHDAPDAYKPVSLRARRRLFNDFG
jgi:hypothetical protein